MWHYSVSTHIAETQGKTYTHTHTGDHIKLSALGLAEPHSHSRNLPALLTSVSVPAKPPSAGPARRSHLQSADGDSEPQRLCEAAWLSHQSALLCFDPSRTCINWCYRNDTLTDQQVFVGLSVCWSCPPALGYVCAIRAESKQFKLQGVFKRRRLQCKQKALKPNMWGQKTLVWIDIYPQAYMRWEFLAQTNAGAGEQSSAWEWITSKHFPTLCGAQNTHEPITWEISSSDCFVRAHE